MPTDERFTDAAVELATDAWVRAYYRDEQGSLRSDELDAGRHVLTALADAGLLLPVGGEVREEWTAEVDLGSGWKRRPYITTSDHEPESVYKADIDDYLRGIVKPKRKLRRTVHTGPWRPVAVEGDQP